MPYIKVADIERAVADRYPLERLSPQAVAELHKQLDVALSIQTDADLEVQKTLRRQLKQLDGQEDRLIELVADGDLPVEKLKTRLRAVTMQRDHLIERLGRTSDELDAGRRSIDSYVALLTRPADLYARAADPVRRQLLETFFSGFSVDSNDDIELTAEVYPAVEALSSLQSVLERGVEKEDGPSRLAETIFNHVVHFFGSLLKPIGSNKSSLVDVVGRYSKPRGLEVDLDRLQHIMAHATRDPHARSATVETKVRNITRRLGAERIKQLVDEYIGGEHTTTLMKTYGLSKTSVIQMLEANGVELRRQPLAPEQIAEAVHLYREELRSLSTIVAGLGLPRETVRRSLIEAGVQMRSRGGSKRAAPPPSR